MGHKASAGSKAHHPLLLGMLSIIILLLTIDIYLSVLSPRSCGLLSMASQRIASGHELYDDNKQEEQQQTDGMTIEELLDIQHHDGRAGIIFDEIKALEDLDYEGDEAWDKLFPPSGGYLFLTSNETSSPWEPWGISMFHSLHCLQMLRDTIQNLESRLNQSNNEHQDDQHREHSHGGGSGAASASTHYKHCFAYIAQVR